MITLRSDQMDTVDRLRASLAVHQSVLLRGPCGFGKTVVAAYMAQGAQRKSKRVIFGVHRIELARQTARTFDQFGIPYGYIMAGRAPNPFANVQIASVDTLRNRHHMLDCDLFIPDEAHLWSGPSRVAILNEVKKRGAKIVALTATPIFPNGRSVGDMVSTIVEGPSERWLIENGFLAQYRAYAPSAPDLTGLHTRMGDYIASELEDRFSKPAIYGDAVRAYKQFAMGKRMIGYCYSRKHGREMAETFRASGINAAFIDGETPDAMRRAVIEDFAGGKTPVLMNAQLFREGFDLSAQVGREVPIQAVGLYNPTQSLALAVQMMMRGMRRQPDASIILDHANILRTHGLPDDEREWSLDPGEKRASSSEASIPTCTCHNCFAVFRPAYQCPECGAVRQVQGREVEQVEGELAEVDIESLRRHQEMVGRKIEERGCKSLADWEKLAAQRGYKKGWAMHRWKAKQARVRA